MFGICQNLKNNSCLSIKVTTGIFLIKVFSEVSVRLERSVNRKHSQGSDVLPPGVVKYLCEGAVCDDPSPTPFFFFQRPQLSHRPCPQDLGPRRWELYTGGVVFSGAFHNRAAKLATRGLTWGLSDFQTRTGREMMRQDSTQKQKEKHKKERRRSSRLEYNRNSATIGGKYDFLLCYIWR